MTLIRWGGFGAACALALSGVLGGALTDLDPMSNPVTVAQGPYGPLVLVSWFLGMLGLCLAWWTARDRVPSARWAVVTIVLWAAPFLFVPPMGSRDVYSYACQGDMFLNGLSPYEYGVSYMPCPWLDTITPIWHDTPAPYGPLFVLLAALAVKIGGSLTGAIVVLRLLAVAGLAVTLWAIPPIARRCDVPVPRALWVAMAGPLVGMHLIGGPHNDTLLIGAVIAALALLAINRRLAIPAGLLLGLALGIKATAVVAIPFAMLMAAPPGPLLKRIRPMAVVGLSAIASMTLFTLVSGLGLGWLGGVKHTNDLIQFSSPPTAVGMAITYLGRLFIPWFNAVPAWRTVALIALGVTLIWLWIRALRSEDNIVDPLRGAALATAATVALAPSFHPWYIMMPLILLAATMTRTFWVSAATVASGWLVLPDGGGLARFAKAPGAYAMTALLCVLAYRWWRDFRTARTATDPPAVIEAENVRDSAAK